MHSREPDFIDARALVDGYIHFGDGINSIPEYARPVIVSVVAEVLSIARKQEFGTISAIAALCGQTGSQSEVSAQIENLCRSRLGELSGLMNNESIIEKETGRSPALQRIDQLRINSRDATRRVSE